MAKPFIPAKIEQTRVVFTKPKETAMVKKKDNFIK